MSDFEGPEPARPGYTNYVLGMVFLVMVMNNLDRTILSILVRPIKEEFALTDTQMGWLLGPAFAVVYSVLSLPIGRWADTRGVRRSIVAGCLALWSLFTAATALSTNYWHLFSARMGVGIGEAGASAPSVSMLSDYLPPERRARGISVISMGAVVGMGLGMVMGSAVEAHLGWRAAFLAAGIPGLLLAAVFRATVREPRRGASEGRQAPQSAPFGELLRHLLSTRTFLFILLASSFSLFAAMGRNLWEPSFLVRSYEMSELVAGSWYFVTGPVPSVIGIYLGGALADRFGIKDPRAYLWVPALGQLLSVPILITYLLWPASDRLALPGFLAALGVPSIPVAFLFSFVGSVLGSFFTAPFLATVQGISPLRIRAVAAALSTIASTLVGLAAGPLLVGVLADRFAAAYGDEALRYSLLVPTAMPIASAIICLWAARYVGRDLARAKEG